MLNGLIWVDLIVLGVIGLSALISLWRGFLREVLSLAAWVAAFVIAFLFVDKGAALLTPYVSVPSVRMILAFGGLFLITLFIGGLVNLLIAILVKHTGLSGTDRMLGIIFGVLRGIVIITVLVLLAGLTPIPQDPWWQQSLFLHHFQSLAVWLQNFLPAEFVDHITYSSASGT